MSFTIKTLGIFLDQVKKFDRKSRRIIYSKIQLIKENPFRFKKIHSKQYSRVFRVRVNLNSKEMRIIYVVIEPNILLVCLLERKKNYQDLEKYLVKIKQEF